MPRTKYNRVQLKIELENKRRILREQQKAYNDKMNLDIQNISDQLMNLFWEDVNEMRAKGSDI